MAQTTARTFYGPCSGAPHFAARATHLVPAKLPTRVTTKNLHNDDDGGDFLDELQDILDGLQEQAGSGWAIDDSAVWSADGRLLAVARQARVVQSEPGQEPGESRTAVSGGLNHGD